MLQRTLILLIPLLTLPALTFDLTLLRRRVKARWRALLYLPNVVILAALLWLSWGEEYTMQADALKGAWLSAALCVLVPETLAAVVLLLGLVFWKLKSVRRWINAVGVGLGVVVFAGLLYGFTMGYRHVVTTRYDYVSPRLPAAFEGYRIVQLSDLHLGTLLRHPQVVRSIVDSVNARQPDLIVFTGDLVNYDPHELYPFVTELRRLHARDGIISIMGNHDYLLYHAWSSEAARRAQIDSLQAQERAMGWQLLLNEHAVLRHGQDSLVIVGLENDGPPRFPALADLERARSGVAPDAWQLLLQHDPSYWRRAVVGRTDIPLMLAGHTHGMQLKILGWSPAAWFYPEWGGEYRAARDQKLFISLGTGEVMLPFRLGAWPEVDVITLRRGNARK